MVFLFGTLGRLFANRQAHTTPGLSRRSPWSVVKQRTARSSGWLTHPEVLGSMATEVSHRVPCGNTVGPRSKISGQQAG